MTTPQPITVLEVERKYTVPPGFQLPALSLLPGIAKLIPDAAIALDATYFDTTDLALATRGITLRRRGGGHDAGWHLKNPAPGARVETQLPPTDTSTVPPQLLALTADVRNGDPVHPIARIRTRRQETRICGSDGTVLAIIADDAVTARRLLPPRHTQQWREVEVELSNGTPDLLDTVERALFDVGASPAIATSKLARAMGLVNPAPETGSPCGRALRDAFAHQCRELHRMEPAAQAGNADGVHDMRVAARRIRAMVRTYGRLLNVPDVAALDGELGWLANVLGAERDLDVLRAKLLRAIARDDPDPFGIAAESRIDRRLAAEMTTARTELSVALRSERYQRVLDTIDAIASQPASDVPADKMYRQARRCLAKADRRMTRALTADAEQDTALHRARKAYKQARYAIETLVPLDRAAEPLIDGLTDLQNALGDQHDAIVAATVLREIADEAKTDNEPVAVYRRLRHRQEAAAMRHRAAGIDRFRVVRQRRLRAWLDEPGSP